MNVRDLSERTDATASSRSPRGPSHARRDGTGRDVSGVSATSHIDPVIANVFPLRTERLAARIAANVVEQLDQLSLIGIPTSFDPETRLVVETSIRLAARKVLES